MGILDMPNELLLDIADNLSVKDLSMFRSTCRRLLIALTPRFQKLCLQDIGGLTALQWAAARGCESLIALAASRGADIDKPIRGILHKTALRSADREYQDRICQYANSGAEGIQQAMEMRTPLYLAACSGRARAVETLLRLGASMKCTGGIDTPAHRSALRGDIDCMRAFIAAGFDPETRGSFGRTILHAAVHGGVGAVRYILKLQGGMNLINARELSGLTPLHHTVGKSRLGAMKVLLRYGADVHATDSGEDTAAHFAAETGQIRCLGALLDAGFDIRTRGRQGQTVIHRAIYAGPPMLEYLLKQERGRRIINDEDDKGSTPLHRARRAWGNEGIAQLLLRYGAHE